VDTVLSLFELLLAKDDIVRRTLQIISRYELNIWDARMIALCATHNCTVLFSEDMQDRGHYDGVRVINPLILGNLEIVDEILTS
jgi:predicted nucleic acid-binding protein